MHNRKSNKKTTMKKVLLLTGIAALFMACGSGASTADAKEAATATESNTEYAINQTESMLSWKGTKPSGDSHSGTVAIKEGKLAMADGALTAGNFVIDLTKMNVTDEGIDEETKAKLLGHLTTGDFFEVEKYPTASFTVTAGTADSLTGNLTIKDVTKSVTIPYTMTTDENGVTASSTFTFDRTIWGITYNSGNFFQNLGDYVIDDIVTLSVSLKATK